MGKSWDTDKGGRDNWIKWMQEVATECKRVLKPGGHAFVWAIPRTSHWTATAWENAGFEIRDVVAHVFGSGFPKSHNIGKNIEKIKVGGIKNLKQVGTKKGIKVETGTQGFSYSKEYVAGKSMGGKQISGDIPVYEINNEYEGWGTALKPAREDWILMRKPIEGTVAENCLKWKVGGLNIDASRIIAYNGLNERPNTSNTNELSSVQQGDESLEKLSGKEKNPTNLLLELQELKYDRREKSELEGGSLELRKDGIQLDKSGQAIGKGQETNTPHNNEIISRTQIDNGETFEQTAEKRRDSASYKREQEGQQDREPSLNELDGTRERPFESSEGIINPEKGERNVTQNNIGRWPSNLIHDGSDEVVELFPNTKPTKPHGGDGGKLDTQNMGWGFKRMPSELSDNGGNASRFFKQCEFTEEDFEYSPFFYCAKASKSERNKGCEGLEEKANIYMARANGTGGIQPGMERFATLPKANNHPTVKPIALMEYLIKLVSREGHTVLDPFAGSFTTGIACINLDRKFIGIERDPEYFKIGKARIDYVIKKKSSSLFSYDKTGKEE